MNIARNCFYNFSDKKKSFDSTENALFIWTLSQRPRLKFLIERSENKIITQSALIENEIGPGILCSSVQQIRALQKYQRHKPCATDYVSILSLLCEILHIVCLTLDWGTSGPTLFSTYALILFS